MSPTVFRIKGYRFYFFSREETRKHVHVRSENGEAKFWIEPEILLAQNYGLSKTEINEIEKIIREKADDIRDAWNKHFGN